MFHELEEVGEGFFVGAVFLGGELAGAFVELRGHFGGFFGRTTEHNENFGNFGNFHGVNGNHSRAGLDTDKKRARIDPRP